MSSTAVGSTSVRTQSKQPRHSLLNGMTPEETLGKYEEELTTFEKQELSHFDLIYTIGSRRVQSRYDICTKDGLYIPQAGEQLGYRYVVEKVLGAGAFGQVLKCLDMKDNGREVAIKLSKANSNET